MTAAGVDNIVHESHSTLEFNYDEPEDVVIPGMPHVKLPLTDVVRSRGWYAKVRYVGAAGQPDPEPIAYAALCAGNLTASGFSILRLDRTAPEQVTTLIRDTVALPANGLSIPVPEVIGWDDLIAAHLSQSEGRAVGKTVLAVQ